MLMRDKYLQYYLEKDYIAPLFIDAGVDADFLRHLATVMVRI